MASPPRTLWRRSILLEARIRLASRPGSQQGSTADPNLLLSRCVGNPVLDASVDPRTGVGKMCAGRSDQRYENRGLTAHSSRWSRWVMADAAPAHYVRAINGPCARVSPLNSLLAFRAVLYVFCSADRTKSASRVRTLKAKRNSRLSPLSIPIPSRVARDAIGFSPQAVQLFANRMYHYAVVHLDLQGAKSDLGTMRITPHSSSLEKRSAGGLNVRSRRSRFAEHVSL